MHRLLTRSLVIAKPHIRRNASRLTPSYCAHMMHKPTLLCRYQSTATSELVEPTEIPTIETVRDQFEEERPDITKGVNKPDTVLLFNDLRRDVYEEIINPNATRGVQCSDLPEFNKILKGHRRGELTILTGPTGVGKTTVISQLSLDYCKQGVPTLWGSFEILNKRLAKKMLSQFAEKDLSESPGDFDRYADEFEKLPLYFLNFHSSTPIHQVLVACQQAVDVYGVQHIIIDNLQFMLSQQARSGLDKWELQEQAIAKIRNFATIQDVHITLVVHPRKDTGEGLDINSIFGSAKVTQEADNVIIIQKYEHTRSLDIKKNRYDGTLGEIYYKFNRETLKIEECLPEERKSSRSVTTSIYQKKRKY
ncbi:hypothetical protein RMATCC62417_02506 [Rhizopus microsporus]|nr:hypothetical protein RMATCC62417_02506 [Rhizopus microsporus]